MYLYLVQHGVALPEDKDSQKHLSPEGKKATRKVAKFLRSKNAEVDSIWHSKKMRSIQTAKILSECVSYQRILARDDLNPNDPVEVIADEIQDLNKDIIIVGHLPFLQKLASLFLSGSQDKQLISFTYSGVVCFEYKDFWRLLWMVTPELL
ncbi:MAG: phosphohistidine phosphatase SixA [Candidatus Omnitrophota bacterium]|nr:MAG: phosphohistidine phosphatase SixA [Candidatus Omnitrophota bacterium]